VNSTAGYSPKRSALYPKVPAEKTTFFAGKSDWLTQRSTTTVSSKTGARHTINSRPLKNVGEAASARQKQAKKRSLRVVNEHF
jgi:hypothetical protein